MKNIRKQLNPKENKVLDLFIKQHKNKTCGCKLNNPDDIYMCPIGLYEDGCTENDLIVEIKEYVETYEDEL